MVGPAGSGKTSLLHLLAGLDRPASGTVALDDRPLRGLDDLELTRLRRDRIGLLLPAASVLPTITVRENIALPLLIARRAPACFRARCVKVPTNGRPNATNGVCVGADKKPTHCADAALPDSLHITPDRDPDEPPLPRHRHDAATP